MSVDERIEAVGMKLELVNRDIQDPVKAGQQDGENIRALARIAEIRESRSMRGEGGEAVESIRRGLAQAKQGLGRSVDEVFDEIEEGL